MQEQRPTAEAASRPATAAEITGILGPVGQDLLVDIQRIGASAAEVLEAFARLEGDDAVGPVAKRAATAKVIEVMALLQANDLGPERE